MSEANGCRLKSARQIADFKFRFGLADMLIIDPSALLHHVFVAVSHPVLRTLPLLGCGRAGQRQKCERGDLCLRLLCDHTPYLGDLILQTLPVADMLALMQQMRSGMMQLGVEV